jgi:hypothetical protein
MSGVPMRRAVDHVNASPSAFSLAEVLNCLRLHSALTTGTENSVSSRLCICGLVRPMSVFLIALAVAVALWGFAYKLSLYGQPQNHASQASVAKMWLGPERHLGLIASGTNKFHSLPAPPTAIDLADGTIPPIHGWQARCKPSEAFLFPNESPLRVGSRSPPSPLESMRSLVVT